MGDLIEFLREEFWGVYVPRLLLSILPGIALGEATGIGALRGIDAVFAVLVVSRLVLVDATRVRAAR